MSNDKVVPIARGGKPVKKQANDDLAQSLGAVVIAHLNQTNSDLKEQLQEVIVANRSLATANSDLSIKVDRLLVGVGRLLDEMNGVRTGDKEEAFARVTGDDEALELPKVQADVALLYPLTSGDIGTRLGFSPQEIGQLLGAKGLSWVGNGDFEELSRWKPGRTRYWHRDVPEKLKVILSNRTPADFGIVNPVVQSIFRRFKERQS